MNKSTTVLIALGLCGLSLQPALAGGDPAVGQQKAATCVACHGADGNSTDPQYPRLAGQQADYIERALMDYQSGARKNPIMSSFAGALSGQDRADLAAWFSSRDPGLVTSVLTHSATQP